MESTVYNQTGKETGKISLPNNIFGLPFNADLVHQVAVAMQANKRRNVAHTKDRGEVRGGGKKPWQQKGTGRARHGSIRSPLWVGGGATHGPSKDKVFSRKINKRMNAKALFSVLSKKFKDNEILFIDNLALKERKTKEAKILINNFASIAGYEKLATKKSNAFHLAIPKKDSTIERSFANLSQITVGEIRNLNLLDILNNKYLVIINPDEAIKFFTAKI